MSLANKQRDAIIVERGEPLLRLDFDVFEGNMVSMWTHFNHSANYEKVKEQLFAIKTHLDEFLRDGAMCPFHKSNK